MEQTGIGCPGGQCPASYASVPANGDCTPEGLLCSYAEGTCACSLGTGPIHAPPARWICIPAQPDCPSPRPDIGTACPHDGVSCNYGACAGGLQLECKGGTWQQAMVPCPQ